MTSEGPKHGLEIEQTHKIADRIEATGLRDWVQKQVHASCRAVVTHSQGGGETGESEPDSLLQAKDAAGAERSLKNTAASLWLELLYIILWALKGC